MRFWLCQTPEWSISWTAVDLVAKREYSTAESNTDAEAPVDSVQLIYLHIILLTHWNCVEVLIWICLCGIPFYFHDCVCMCTCIYGRVATWKINTFIFCQLSLHFCLLCPDSQLGGTLISSCETQYLGGFENFRERALSGTEINEELMLQVNWFWTLVFSFRCLSLNPSYTTLMFASCTGQSTSRATA